MGTVDILEQVVVWTNVSAVVVMVVAFVTTAFVVVVMIIRHMCELEVLYAMPCRSQCVDYQNRVQWNRYKQAAKSLLVHSITLVGPPDRSKTHFVSIDTVDTFFHALQMMYSC